MEEVHSAQHCGLGGCKSWGYHPDALRGPLLTHSNPTVKMVGSGQAVQVLYFLDTLSGKALPALLKSSGWVEPELCHGSGLIGPCPQNTRHIHQLGSDSQAANNGDPRDRGMGGAVGVIRRGREGELRPYDCPLGSVHCQLLGPFWVLLQFLNP